MGTHERDLEIGRAIAVHVAFNKCDVTARSIDSVANLKQSGLPGESGPTDKVERRVARASDIGVDTAQVDLVDGFERQDGVRVANISGAYVPIQHVFTVRHDSITIV